MHLGLQASDSDGREKLSRAERRGLQRRADSETREDFSRLDRCSSRRVDSEVTCEELLRNARAHQGGAERRSLPRGADKESGDELLRTRTSSSSSQSCADLGMARGSQPRRSMPGGRARDRDRIARDALLRDRAVAQREAAGHAARHDLPRTRNSQSCGDLRHSAHDRQRRSHVSEVKKSVKVFRPAGRRCLEASGFELEPRRPCAVVNGDVGPVFLAHQRRKWCATERGPEPAMLTEELVESRLSSAALPSKGAPGVVGESADDSDADASLSCAETMLDSDTLASTEVVSGASTENGSYLNGPVSNVASEPSSEDLMCQLDRGVSLPATWSSPSWSPSDSCNDGRRNCQPGGVVGASSSSCNLAVADAFSSSLARAQHFPGDSGDEVPPQEVHRAHSTGPRLVSTRPVAAPRQLPHTGVASADQGTQWADIPAEEPIPVAQGLRAGVMAGFSSRRMQKAMMLGGSQARSPKAMSHSRGLEASFSTSSTSSDPPGFVQGGIAASAALAADAPSGLQSPPLSQSRSTSNMLSSSAKQASSLIRQGSAERSLCSAERLFSSSRGMARPHSAGPASSPSATGSLSGNAVASMAASPSTSSLGGGASAGPSRVHLRHDSGIRALSPSLSSGASQHCNASLSPSSGMASSLALTHGLPLGSHPSGRPPGLPAGFRRPPAAPASSSAVQVTSAQPGASSPAAPVPAAGPASASGQAAGTVSRETSAQASSLHVATRTRASSPGASSSYRAPSPPAAGVHASTPQFALSPTRAPFQIRSSFFAHAQRRASG